MRCCVDNIRLSTILALTRDAVLRARAWLACGVVSVRTLSRTTSEAARGAWTNHIITLLALNSKLRVCSAIAIHTCGAICIRLLAWWARRTRLVVIAHDIRLSTILALTRDAVLRARAWLACGVVSIRTLSRTTSEAARGARTNHIITLLTLNSKLRVCSAIAIHTCGAICIRLLAWWARRTRLVVIAHDIRLSTILALTRDAVLRARAWLACGVVSIRTLSRTTSEAARGARTNHIITLLTLNSKLRVCSAIAIHTCGAICIRLLAWWARRTRLVVIAHDIRLSTILALTRDAVLRARAWLACGVVSIRTLSRTTSEAARGARTNHIITLLTLNSKLRVCSAIAIHTCGAICIRLLAWWARRTRLVVIAHDIRLSTILALTRDAVLRARAWLACGVVSIRTLSRTTSEAARGARTNHIITLLTLNSKLRVCSAIAIHTCGAICIRLLAWWARRTRLVVIAHDIRLSTILALTRDAVLRARAWLACGVVSVGSLSRTTSEAARGARTNHIITLLTLNSKLRVCSAIAIHTCGAICIRLLAWWARRTRLVVIAHDIRLSTILALTRDAVLRARAWLACGVVSVGSLSRTTSEAAS